MIMAKIANWSKTRSRNASDVGMSGVVREWTHDETDDVIQIVKVDDEESKFYGIRENDGDIESARSTLRGAEKDVMDTIRYHTDGLGDES